MRTLDSNYEDWKLGDKVVWEVEPYEPLPLEVIGLDRENGIIYYKTPDGSKNQIKREYLMRVTETESDKEVTVALGELITDLCEQPSIDLGGVEGIVEVRWDQGVTMPFLRITDRGEDAYLDPEQVLLLLRWLKPQEEKLVALLEALYAQKTEDASTKDQREAERLNALKALHSDAVVAWQQGGSEGPCPTFADIVRKEQFIRVELFEESAEAPMFVRQYPMLERIERKRG